MFKNAYSLFMLGFISLSSVTVYAGFDIIGDDELNTYPERYGQAHTVPFRKALSGDESIGLNDEIPLSDPKSLAVDIPKIGHTWFISSHIGRPRTKLKKINVSNLAPGGNIIFQDKTSEADSLFNLSLSWGYRWVGWAWNLEFIATEGMDLALNLTSSGVPYQSNNTADNYILFFNLHYFFSRYFDWIPEAIAPHLNIGVGPNFQRTKSDLLFANQVISSKSKNRFEIAWNVSFGIAYRITQHFLGATGNKASIRFSWT